MRIKLASWFLLHVFQSIVGKESMRLAPLAQKASVENFPHQASIRINGKHTCGGSLISISHVLTAAHCIHKLIEKPRLLRSQEVTVGVGSAYLNGGDEYPVRRLSEYQGYVGETYEFVVPNDIAVITLREPVSLSATVQIINLPPVGMELEEGTVVVVSGFGNAYKGGPASRVLQQSPMKIVSQRECTEEYLDAMGKEIVSTQICARFSKYAGTCQGDSGGPLIYQGEESNVVVGVVSAGVEECGDGTSDTYTKVSSFIPYIEYEMNYDPENDDGRGRRLARAQNLGSPYSRTTESPYPNRIPRKINLGGLFNQDHDGLFDQFFNNFALRSRRQGILF